MNPVAANMVSHPGEYRWSSYLCNAQGKYDACITPHKIYVRLGTASSERQATYRDMFRSVLDPEDVRVIRTAAACSMPTGDNRFRQQIERALKRKIGYQRRG